MIRLVPARARCYRFQLVLLRYSLEKAHLLGYLFLLKQDKRSEENGTQKSRMS